jgi:hypothetical protein
MGGSHIVSGKSVPDFTTEPTEITETDRKEGRVWTRIRNPFLLASAALDDLQAAKQRSLDQIQ